MNLLIVLFSLLQPSQLEHRLQGPTLDATTVATASAADANPLRYRGIERLLAKFEREAQVGSKAD
jgi:hypothetical protein